MNATASKHPLGPPLVALTELTLNFSWLHKHEKLKICFEKNEPPDAARPLSPYQSKFSQNLVYQLHFTFSQQTSLG